MAMPTPLTTLQNLQRLYQDGFQDPVTDAVLIKVALSQAARDEAVLRDLERDLHDLEEQYQMPSHEFFRRWQAGEMDDTADFMDWNALYQMATEVRARLELLRGKQVA